MAQQSEGFTLEDAVRLQRESATMSVKKAHKFLTTWRSEKSLPAASQGAGGPAASQGSAGGPAASQATAQGLVPFSMEKEDLTNSPDFDARRLPGGPCAGLAPRKLRISASARGHTGGGISRLHRRGTALGFAREEARRDLLVRQKYGVEQSDQGEQKKEADAADRELRFGLSPARLL